MSPGDDSDVTAVVVTWNSAPDLDPCLASIPAGVRTMVVDNDSGDGSVAVARSHGAKVVELDRNVGFSAAVNLVIPQVSTSYTLLLNPDVTVGAGAIERCVDELDRDRTVAVVGPNTRLPNGRPEAPAARRDRTAVHIWIESLGLVHVSRHLDLQMVQDRSVDQDVDAVNGAFLLVRTEVLRQLGGLDEDVFMYLEDQDLCRRVREAGHRVRFLTHAHVVHGNGTSTGRGDEGQRVRAYLHRIDADLEYLRRYGRPGEAGAAVAAFIFRSLIGLVVSLGHLDRRSRYRAALGYSWRQVRGRHPAAPV